MKRSIFEVDHEDYRSSVRRFLSQDVAPRLHEWDEAGIIDREVWRAAGRHGLVGLMVPEGLGGGGVQDMRYRLVVAEEVARIGATSFGSGLSVHDDIVVPYLVDLCTPEQAKRWLPRLSSGEHIGAIAMTEPAAGSDLRGIQTIARRDGDDWVLDGQKTFITNGIHADVVIVFARTPDPGGYSLFVVERDMPGFTRGTKHRKVGLDSQDTAELAFEGVKVPGDHLLGDVGRGLVHLMERLPRERISIAMNAISAATAVLDWTTEYVFTRTAFGQPIGDFQNTRFELADIETRLDVTRSYIDQSILALDADELTAVDAAKAKWWATEVQQDCTSRCLQLFGGYGYMSEYPVAQAFRDARVQTIYGGTTQIMKEIIGRDIAGRAGASR